jgi:hypothetical protein
MHHRYSTVDPLEGRRPFTLSGFMRLIYVTAEALKRHPPAADPARPYGDSIKLSTFVSSVLHQLHGLAINLAPTRELSLRKSTLEALIWWRDLLADELLVVEAELKEREAVDKGWR